MANNSNYDSKFNKKKAEESLLSEESKARAASLLDFINSVKESSAYLSDELQISPKAEAEKDETAHEAVVESATVEEATAEAAKKETTKTVEKAVAEAAEEVTAETVEKAATEADKKATEETSVEETAEAKAPQPSEPEQIASETVIKPEMTEDELIVDDEDAFNFGFNPAFAFYDDEDEPAVIASAALEQTEPTDNVAEAAQEAPSEPKTFERVGTKQLLTVSETKPEKTKEKKNGKALLASFGSKHRSPVKKDDKKQETAKKVKDKPVKTETAKKAHSFPKKAVAAAVLAVAILTAGIMAVKGLVTVFATDDIYGIFVEGRLVAASNQQGKIEEAIDDFLSYYKVLEEQGSLTNLRFTGSYEIRQLTREEIKAGIYTAKNTTKATTEATTEATAANGDTAAVTDQTTAQTTAQTTEATTAVQTDANGNTTHATTNQSNPLNKEGDKITVSQNVDELKNILFYGSEPKMYTVVEGDNLSKIAKRENLTLTELMVPNPDLLEDSTLGIDQEIRIVKMSGPLKLSFSREVTVTEDIAYETVEEKTDELYEGEKKTTQEGKEGIRQEVTKYDYENNVISVKTPVSNEVLEEPTKKIVKVGTKKKTSADQSSGLADSGSTDSGSSSSFGWPVNGARLTSKFGPRKAPKKGASSYHRGIDLAISTGTPIYATKSGTVTIASYVGGYGNLVELNHGGGYTSRYGHCSKLAVKRGQKVNKGDVIAYVGNTGVSTGPHLHFEIRKNGTAVNPLNYLPQS